MRWESKLETNPPDLLKRMTRGGWLREMRKEANREGGEAVQFARRMFRTGGTTKTRTAVRSGALRRSYGHKTEVQNGQIFLDYGPIRAKGGEVPIHARVHEGFNAAGQKVDRFVIRPRKAKALRFPVYKKNAQGRSIGGMAKKNIESWVFAKQVVLYPRPTFPSVERRLSRELPKAGSKAFRRLFGEAA